jgi:hypothetical protein
MRKVLYIIVLIQFSSCEDMFFNTPVTDKEYIFESFWHEIDRNYSYFDRSGVDWDSVYTKYRHQIMPETTDEELFQIFSSMADLLHDAHTNIYTPLGIGGNIDYFEKYPINQIEQIESYFDYYQANNKIFEFGKLSIAPIGYIKIKTFEEEKERFGLLDSILRSFNSTIGLIVDVRSNRGGNISNTKVVVSRFADSARTPCRYRLRNGPGHNNFSEWIDFNIGAANGYTYKNKPIVILTDRQSYSATEWFIASAAILPNVTLVGDTTGGGSARPIIRELPNGWILRISNSQVMLPSGMDFQFTGIYPDIPVWIRNIDAAKNKDTILDQAISIIYDNEQ